MTTALELVYEYRHLMGKCQGGAGLDMDEIQAVDTIEALFAEEAGGGGQFAAEAQKLTATVRGDRGKLCDPVRVAQLGPDQMVVRGCPWVERGALLEILFDDDELMLSYRFRGRVRWTSDDRDGLLRVGIELVGVPVLVRRGPRSARSIEAHEAALKRRADRAGAAVAA